MGKGAQRGGMRLEFGGDQVGAPACEALLPVREHGERRLISGGKKKQKQNRLFFLYLSNEVVTRLPRTAGSAKAHFANVLSNMTHDYT